MNLTSRLTHVRSFRASQTGTRLKRQAVKKAVTIDVFTNRNNLYQSDIDACLKATGAYVDIRAEGQLYNPALFSRLTTSDSISLPSTHDDYFSNAQILSLHLLHASLGLEYLTIVQKLKTRTSVSGSRGTY